MEGLERVIFFANADELDRLAGDLADGERRAAASIAVHFGEDDAGECELLVEFVGRFDGVLSCHRVSDK